MKNDNKIDYDKLSVSAFPDLVEAVSNLLDRFKDISESCMHGDSQRAEEFVHDMAFGPSELSFALEKAGVKIEFIKYD